MHVAYDKFRNSILCRDELFNWFSLHYSFLDLFPFFLFLCHALVWTKGFLYCVEFFDKNSNKSVKHHEHAEEKVENKKY